MVGLCAGSGLAHRRAWPNPWVKSVPFHGLPWIVIALRAWVSLRVSLGSLACSTAYCFGAGLARLTLDRTSKVFLELTQTERKSSPGVGLEGASLGILFLTTFCD